MHTPLDYIPSEQQSQVTPLHDRWIIDSSETAISSPLPCERSTERDRNGCLPSLGPADSSLSLSLSLAHLVSVGGW